MRFIARASGTPRRLAILSGAFNPPTRAHCALAEAALEHAAELLFVLPQRFPHKQWHGPDATARIDLLQPLLGPRHSLAQSEGGLFLDIAREARRHYPHTEFWFVCGRDAAERILTWDYPDGATAESLLEQFGLLVAPRAGVYQPPTHLSHRIRSLDLAPEWSDISSTAVRERLARGESWQHLVPEPLHAAVARLYGQSDGSGGKADALLSGGLY